MKILPYDRKYKEDVFKLWNTGGVREGYAPEDREELDKLLLEHPYFDPDIAFVLEDNEEIIGFICGTGAEDLPGGEERGYITCTLLNDRADTDECTDLLMEALEDRFRTMGKSVCMCHFFNPVKLPWIIPGTNGAQHNNMPGIACESVLYKRMCARGYDPLTVSGAMYLDLSKLSIPVAKEKELTGSAAQMGYSVDWYDAARHKGLREMVEGTGSAEWSAEVPKAAVEINMLVALKGDEVVGFTGPVYPEKTGRGYFTGIAVSSAHEHHGLGSLLFYRLCREEKAHGAAYMSLFTGPEGNAQKIYHSVGFEFKKYFSPMKKQL